MSKIENHRYTIQEAFSQNFYVVPDYQREYVWDDREVAKLLEDFDEQVGHSDNEYFIGMVLVSSTAPSRFDVIDGQQRLTTLFLVLCALRRRLGSDPAFAQVFNGLLASTYTGTDGKPMSSAKLDPRYENASAVTGRLAQESLSPAELRTVLKAEQVTFAGSVKRLVEAYEQITGFLDDNYRSIEDVQRYWGFLANQVVFIQIGTDVGSALKIFETINERGVGLSPMDLLKNLLFTNVEPGQFTELKNAWKKVTSPLEVKGEKPLRFLRYFLMASYNVSNGEGRPTNKSPDIIREDEIYHWLTHKANAEVVGYETDPFGFVTKLSKAAETYLGYINRNGNDGQPNPAVARLLQLTGGAFSLHYILLLAASPLPKHLFDRFVEQLEAFLFSFIFTKAPSRELERNFSVWSDELREIAGMSPELQESALNSFVEARLTVGAEGRRRELVDALRRYSIRSAPVYRTRYLLARLTQHVDRAFNGSAAKGVQDLTAYLNLEIEHILPQNPSAEHRQAWLARNPESVYEDDVSGLGNLTLLEKPHNSVASHGDIASKLPLYAKSSNYLTRSLAGLQIVGSNTSVTSINQHLAEAGEWDLSDIEQRQERLIELALVIWKVGTASP
jgi:hypothetical protein